MPLKCVPMGFPPSRSSPFDVRQGRLGQPATPMLRPRCSARKAASRSASSAALRRRRRPAANASRKYASSPDVLGIQVVPARAGRAGADRPPRVQRPARPRRSPPDPRRSSGQRGIQRGRGGADVVPAPAAPGTRQRLAAQERALTLARRPPPRTPDTPAGRPPRRPGVPLGCPGSVGAAPRPRHAPPPGRSWANRSRPPDRLKPMLQHTLDHRGDERLAGRS